MIKKNFIAVFCSLALVVALSACGQTEAKSIDAVQKQQQTTTQSNAATTQPSPAKPAVQPTAPKRIQAKVITPIDGDTIKVQLNGKEETIRLLLIDTPETHHPKLGEQPYGKEASNFTKSLVEGKTVELEQDVNNGPDKYGRLLYYVYVDGKSIQEQLLQKGLARVAYIYVPNVKYVDKYREIQGKAQKAGVGIWSVENYAKEDGFHPEVVKKNGPGKKPQTPVQQIKSQPAPQTEQQTNESVYYKNCSAARALGASPLYRGDPGYRPGLDRDGDGIACE